MIHDSCTQTAEQGARGSASRNSAGRDYLAWTTSGQSSRVQSRQSLLRHNYIIHQQTPYTIQHGTATSTERLGALPCPLQIGKLSSRCSRPHHSSYILAQHLRLRRTARNAKHPEVAPIARLRLTLEVARDLCVGHAERLSRWH